jgi:RNA polymerase sigma factor (sigma-70 family)
MRGLSDAAKEELAKRLEPFIRNYSRKFCRRWTSLESEEVAQVMRERMVREMDKFDLDKRDNDSDEPFFRWRMVNAAKDHARTHGHYTRHAKTSRKTISLDTTVVGNLSHGGEEMLIDTLAAPEQRIGDPIQRQQLREAIATLTETEVRAINRVYFHGLTIEEIGREFGVSGAAISQTLAVALAKLRKHLSHEYSYEPPVKGTFDESELPQRELETLEGAAAGEQSAQTAERLGISDHTVKGYRKNVIRRLEAENISHAVAIGYQRGILKIPEESAA